MSEETKSLNNERQKQLMLSHQREVESIKKRFEASKTALEARFNQELSRVKVKHKTQLATLQKSKLSQETLKSRRETKH